MRVYMIRHGESETNLHHQLTGWLDVQLTEKGRKDAEFARSVLKGIKFDRVLSSDLSRARETARIALPDHEAEPCPLLREINVGSFERKSVALRNAELQKRSLSEDVAYKPFGGESLDEFKARVLGFMNTLPSLGCETIAVFSHAGCLRLMLDEAIGYRHNRQNVLCLNCTVEILEYGEDGWSLHSWINPI